jgi:archaellum biogenesis ATPase FlaH
MKGPGCHRAHRADEAQYHPVTDLGKDQDRPDFETACRFLEFLDPDEDRHTFQLTADRPGASKAVRFGKLETVWRQLVAANQEGSGVHVMVNAGDLRGRRAENVTRVRAVVVDLDGTQLPTSFPIAPHAVIRTSPGHCHLYYRASIPLDLFKEVQLGLAVTFGGDPCVHDRPRVFRLPGLHHMKETPHLVRLEHVQPDAAPLTLDELRSAFPLVQEQLSGRNQEVDKVSIPSNPESQIGASNEAKHLFAARLLELVAERAQGINETGRHETLRLAARWCLDNRLSRGEAEALVVRARDLLPPRTQLGRVPDSEVLDVIAWTYETLTPGDPWYSEKPPHRRVRGQAASRTEQVHVRTLASAHGRAKTDIPLLASEGPDLWRSYQLDQLPEAQDIEWLWHERIPRGSISFLGGAPGVGKSALAFAFGLSVATGQAFLGHDVAGGPVLYFDVDASADTQGPLLKTVMRGLGLKNEQLRDRFKYFELQPDRIQALDLGHLREMKRVAQEMGASLIILDAWGSAFWSTRSNSAEDVAEKMAELRSLTRDGFTILIIDHLPKPTTNGANPVDRGLIGSVMKTANARSVYLLLPHEGADDGSRILVLKTKKNNAGPHHPPLGIEPVWADDGVSFQIVELPKAASGTFGQAAASGAVLEVLAERTQVSKIELIKAVRLRAGVETRTIEAALAGLIGSGDAIAEKDAKDARRRIYRLAEVLEPVA